MDTKKLVGWVVALAAVNWGLAAFNMNLVELVLGTGTLTKVVYIVIGLVGAYKVYMLVTGGYKKR